MMAKENYQSHGSQKSSTLCLHIRTKIYWLDYQLYLKANFPEDLDKIYKIFPQARIILMQKQKEDEERKCNKDH